MDYLKELEGKRIHDHVCSIKFMDDSARRVMVAGPLIVGAGPSGMAAAACLKERGISSIILERANCIGSLWQHKTYDRLRLHLPKHFCDLPRLPFPANFPTYPTKQQFVDYLNSYSDHFDIKPMFNIRVVSAEFDRRCGYWRVRAVRMKMEEIEYSTKWLIVATGENAEELTPEIEGIDEFEGPVLHTSSYRRGEIFRRKKVLVIGCGNSGMEICLDLCNYNACPSLVVRNSVHILPQEMFGRSTFDWSVSLLRWLPLRFVDRLLLLASRLMLGDTSRYGLHRPHLGPLELKNVAGKTPVLDVGTLAEIKSGNIKVYKEVKRVTNHGAEFVDGKIEKFDAIILATGYKSNVPTWLKEMDMFSEKDGLPRKAFPNGWKGDNGLYAIGFAKRGLVGASSDAEKISQDIDLHFHACSTNLYSFL